MWDLIVSVPDHCLSFYFTIKLENDIEHKHFFFFACFYEHLLSHCFHGNQYILY